MHTICFNRVKINSIHWVILFLIISFCSNAQTSFISNTNLTTSDLTSDQFAQYNKYVQSFDPVSTKFVTVNQLSTIQQNGRITVQVPGSAFTSCVFDMRNIEYTSDDDYFWVRAANGQQTTAYHTVTNIQWPCGNAKPDQNDAGANVAMDNIDFTISPNPSSGVLNIHIEDIQDEDYTLTITNHLGKVIYEHRVALNAGNNQILGLPDFLPGVYICTLKSKNTQASRQLYITR